MAPDNFIEIKMFFDVIGSIFSLLSTYYFIRLNNKAWLMGIIATCVNGFLYWHKGIYADAGLELFYFFSMGYGWYQWLNLKHKESKPIRYLTLGQLAMVLLLLSSLTGLFYYLLHHYTSSQVAALDAGTTALSLTAQLLMCHKIIFTWVLWFISDALYVCMYFNKELPFHSFLMVLYTILAITGFITWYRKKELYHSLITDVFASASPQRKP